MSRDEKISLALEKLSKREEHAYRIWCGANQPPLAPSLNAKLFNLYLQGKGTEEIRRLNQQLSLGQIVAAKIEGDWDQRRLEHLDTLLRTTSERVQQVTLETADFVCDLLAVANREHGDRLRRYLQTGDSQELGDFRVDSIYNLKQVIEVLQKLTGQERVSRQQVNFTGQVIHTPSLPQDEGKTLPAVEAEKALRLLLGKREEN